MLPLASAVVRCAVRRTAAWALSAPRAATIVCGVLVLLPLASARVGAAVGDLLGAALGELAVARAALAGAALPCLAAGVAVAVTRSECPVIAREHAVAPVRPVDRIAAGTVVPAGIALGLVLPVSISLVAPVAAASPGGIGATPAVVAALAGAALAGGAFASGWQRAARGRSREAVGGLVLAGGSLGALGPVEPAARALAGDASSLAAVGWSLLVCALLGSAWICLGGPATERVRRPRRTAAWMPSRPGAACWRAALALLGRRRDCRAACVGAGALALAGLLVAVVGRAPAPTGLLLASSGTAVCLAPVGLAATGAILEGRSAWCVAPVRRTVVALGWGAATATLVLAGTALALAPAVALDPPSLSVAALVLAIGVGAWACALAAGAVVPWRPYGVIDQAASLVAFGVACAAVSLVVARAGPALAGTGLGDDGSAAVLVAMLVAAALVLTARRLGAVG